MKEKVRLVKYDSPASLTPEGLPAAPCMSCWYYSGAAGTGECRSPYGRKCVVDSTMNWLFEVDGEEGGGAPPGPPPPPAEGER